MSASRERGTPVRRIVLASVTTVTAVVLLLGHRTGLPAAHLAAGSSVATSGGAGSASSSASSRTVVGAAADTRFGPVQVRITVVGGRITAAEAVDYPSSNPRDAMINSQAIPMLNADAVQKQSAQVDTVSGATYTSDGYQRSLQSAIDKAGL